MVAALDYAVINQEERSRRRKRKHSKELRHITLKCQKNRIPDSPKVTNRETKLKKEEAPQNTSKMDAPKPVQKKRAELSTMLILAALGKACADVLGKLHKEFDPNASQIKVVGAKPTIKEELLIR